MRIANDRLCVNGIHGAILLKQVVKCRALADKHRNKLLWNNFIIVMRSVVTLNWCTVIWLCIGQILSLHLTKNVNFFKIVSLDLYRVICLLGLLFLVNSLRTMRVIVIQACMTIRVLSFQPVLPTAYFCIRFCFRFSTNDSTVHVSSFLYDSHSILHFHKLLLKWKKAIIFCIQLRAQLECYLVSSPSLSRVRTGMTNNKEPRTKNVCLRDMK